VSAFQHIGVLGAGAWGSALANVAARAGRRVRRFGRPHDKQYEPRNQGTSVNPNETMRMRTSRRIPLVFVPFAAGYYLSYLY